MAWRPPTRPEGAGRGQCARRTISCAKRASARGRSKSRRSVARSKTIEAAKQTAQAEGARIIAASQTEAANEATRVRDQLRREFGALVVRGASQLLEREIDARAHAQLIERLTEEIARG